MTPALVAVSDPRYPIQVLERLKDRAPQQLAVLGNPELLNLSKIALFCSTRSPGSAILTAHDQAARWRDKGICVISGFHSPLERECLKILLRGSQPVILCAARGLEDMRLPIEWKKPLETDRFLAVSPFPASIRRVTKELAVGRNRLVADMADEVVFAHVEAGGSLETLSSEIAHWGIRLSVL